MATIKKLLKAGLAGKRNSVPTNAAIKNSQKATTYVGKGVLKNGGNITPVPNGPLIKKKGEFKGSTLKNGGSTPAWTRKEGKSESGGLNAKGVASYRAENPGSKLKTAVTTKPSKLKPGSKSANRRKSFCARMSGMKKRLTSAKTANDPNSRINKSLRKWNC